MKAVSLSESTTKWVWMVAIGMVLLGARFLNPFPNWSWFGATLILLGSVPLLGNMEKFLVFGVALVASDAVIGFYPGWVWVMVGHLGYLVVGRGLWDKLWPVFHLERPLMASIWFFIMSNFGVWLETSMYPKTWEGLLMCYGAAVPFFRNSLSSDLVFFISIMLMRTLWIQWREKKKALSSSQG
ncbi:MAG: DUF6580 family putative transport protein [Pseudobdellovibrionaceae bacterium]|nr:DUF6580 family putative transport protein [Pseudobdellovibrionaceae bacterium]